MLRHALVSKSNFAGMVTPYLVLDLQQVRQQLATVRAAFAPLHPSICFAVKANHDEHLLATLRDAHCGFDVASLAEIQRLDALGVPAHSMIFSNPVKIPHHIAAAYAAGVERFAFDSIGEAAKLAREAPTAQVVLRVEVPHHGSRWPLDRKFGASPDEAVGLLQQAQARGLTPLGLTFHVGSQNESASAWLAALDICAAIWEEARQAGIRLRLIDLGGGLPALYTTPVPTIAAIGAQVRQRALQHFGTESAYIIEPGRYLVADAGTLVTTVIGTAERHGRRWIYVDMSVFSGLLEVTGGWQYPMTTAKDDQPKQHAILAGPTCDSTDILAEDVLLPDLVVGDRLQLQVAGAYTTSYHEYNGIPFPQVWTIDGSAELEEAA